MDRYGDDSRRWMSVLRRRTCPKVFDYNAVSPGIFGSIISLISRQQVEPKTREKNNGHRLLPNPELAHFRESDCLATRSSQFSSFFHQQQQTEGGRTDSTASEVSSLTSSFSGSRSRGIFTLCASGVPFRCCCIWPLWENKSGTLDTQTAVVNLKKFALAFPPHTTLRCPLHYPTLMCSTSPSGSLVPK